MLCSPEDLGPNPSSPAKCYEDLVACICNPRIWESEKIPGASWLARLTKCSQMCLEKHICIQKYLLHPTAPKSRHPGLRPKDQRVADVWWCTCAKLSASGTGRRNLKFRVILGYVASLKPTWTIRAPVSNIKSQT